MAAFNGPVIFKPGMRQEPTCFHGIRQARNAECECACKVVELMGLDQDTGYGNVYLQDGQFTVRAVDLEVPARGLRWRFERAYRSGISFDGPLGHNWEFNYNRRLLLEADGSVLRMDGYGRADRYTLAGAAFASPAGFYTRLVRNEDGSYIEWDRARTQVVYSVPDTHSISCMSSIRDRNGNEMKFRHNAAGQLTTVIDPFGRPFQYLYNGDARLIEVKDFIGRQIHFEYDRSGDLVAVTSPRVADTPNGNNFPEGKTVRYRYAASEVDQGLNHCLVEVIAPNEVATGGPPRIHVKYNSEVGTANFGRVLSQTLGGINASGVPAGGTIAYEYLELDDSALSEANKPVFQNTVTDRNGNKTQYQFNGLGNVVRIREFTNRQIRVEDPAFFETSAEYNADGELTRLLQAEGNSFEYGYDDKNPDRLQQGNLLTKLQVPDPKRGGEQLFVKTTFAYDPIYNQLRSVTDARGNDSHYVPPNGGNQSPERYTTCYIFDYQEGKSLAQLTNNAGITRADLDVLLRRAHVPMGIGDVNGDGGTDQFAGNVVKIVRPTVSLLSDSNMARLTGSTEQPIVETFTYNHVGQPTSHRDAEGNVTVYDYYPEDNPTGQGELSGGKTASVPCGHLKEIKRDVASDPTRNSGQDPTPTQIRQRYLYSPSSIVRRKIDGRGIATDYVVNELNQVVQIIRAADVSEAFGNPHEPNWRNCTNQRLVECTHGMIAFQYRTSLSYDFNCNLIERVIENRDSNNEGLVGRLIMHRIVYDILDSPIEEERQVTAEPGDNVRTKYRRDRNGNVILELKPVANLPARHPQLQPNNVRSYVFDERDLLFLETRGGVTSTFASLEAHGNRLERHSTAFNAKATTKKYRYDANRNLIQTASVFDGTIDRVDRVVSWLYDGFDRWVSLIDAAGNQSFEQHDPVGNRVRTSHFGPVGGASPINNTAAQFNQPITLTSFEQPLLSQVEHKHDEVNRRFERRDRLFAYSDVRYVRKQVLTDGRLGQSGDGWITHRYEYDRLGRPTFLVSPDLGTSQMRYDGASRVILLNDAEGNQVAYAYDDDDNLVRLTQTDITQRDAVEAGRIPDLAEEFTVSQVFDSLNRRIRFTDNVGQTVRYLYDSRGNLVLTSDAQHTASSLDLIDDPLGVFPAPGQDNGGITRLNLPGNTVAHFYDALNREIAVVRDLRRGGQGRNAIDLSNSSNPDGLIVTDYEWDANSRLIGVADDGMPQSQNTSIGVIESTNPLGNVTRYAFDEQDRPSRILFADGSIAGYEYDVFGELSTIIDQNGSTFRLSYAGTALPVLIEITPASSDDPHPLGGAKPSGVSWKVVGTRLQLLEYDGLGRVTSSMDADGPFLLHVGDPHANVTTLAYDSVGRLVEEVQKRNNTADAEFVVSSRWDEADNRVGIIYPSGKEVGLTYDRLHRVRTIRDLEFDEFQTTATYDYLGSTRIALQVLRNATRLSYVTGDVAGRDVGYDKLARLVSKQYTLLDGTPIASFAYAYDRANNKLFEAKAHVGDRQDYSYDSIYRLVRVAHQGGTDDTWTLDGVNNWIRRRGVRNETNNVNGYASFGGVPEQYDANGNLVDDGVVKYHYDALDRLRKVTRKSNGDVVAVYRYDAHSRRTDRILPNGGSTAASSNSSIRTPEAALQDSADPLPGFPDWTRYLFDGWDVVEAGHDAAALSKK